MHRFVGDSVRHDPLLLKGFLWLQRKERNSKVLKSILYFFESQGKQEYLQEYLIKEEIQSTSNIAQLMREDSINTNLLLLNVQHIGNSWISQKLSGPLKKVLSSNCDMEIDPSRLVETKGDVEKNLDNLLQYSSWIVDNIILHPGEIPSSLRSLCKTLNEESNKRFPGSGYRCVANILFLRFICPIISAPETIHITKIGSISSESRRKLVLIAKIFQSIANQGPPCNEAYMEPTQAFIHKQVKKINSFFLTLLHDNDSPTTQKKKDRVLLTASAPSIIRTKRRRNSSFISLSSFTRRSSKLELRQSSKLDADEHEFILMNELQRGKEELLFDFFPDQEAKYNAPLLAVSRHRCELLCSNEQYGGMDRTQYLCAVRECEEEINQKILSNNQPLTEWHYMLQLLGFYEDGSVPITVVFRTQSALRAPDPIFPKETFSKRVRCTSTNLIKAAHKRGRSSTLSIPRDDITPLDEF